MTGTTFQTYLADHTARIEPLSRDVHLAYWDATISGKREDFARFADLDFEYQTIYTDAEEFAKVSAWRDDGSVTDPVERRALDIVHRSFLRHQVDPGLLERSTRLATEITNEFNVYRVEIDGRELTSNEVREVLRRESDSHVRRRVWEADKGVGPVIRDRMLELVDMRNQAAGAIGFANYYEMSMKLSEQEPDQIRALFTKLEELTREPFAALKGQIDSALAARSGVAPEELEPWHYEDPFFQEAPRIYSVDLDRYYAGKDVVALVRGFFEGIGLEVSDILERSDLFEKPGKEQHAYCMDLDRKGDIRVLANVKDDENWTGTMLHELGHAVYDRYIDPSLPFLLREHAHIFATEAIAMLFGRLSKNAAWMQAVLGISDAEKARVADTAQKQQRLAQLVFARWCQVMVHFERELYSDPAQDLNALWWDLVGHYQMVGPRERRDAPDWATKIHVVTAPVYYHNYMLGELLASQLDHAIHTEVLAADTNGSPLVGETGVGAFLKEKVFAPGKRLHWDEMIRGATGEPLNPDYFVRQFIG